MRIVTGPTDRVVVVGAGLAGLSAALRLAGAGRQVTVLERAAGPGGRAGRIELGGYRFDAGATVLTAPELVADALAAVGEELTDRLELRPVVPAYRGRFADGGTLDVLADPDAMAAQIERRIGWADAAGYRRFVAWVSELYRLQLRAVIDRNLDSARDLPLGTLARLTALGGLRSLAPQVGRFVRDDRLRRLFGFQSLYAGVSPYTARALYAVIAYLDTVAGVVAPVGGMAAVPEALAAAAADHGVTFSYDTTAHRLERIGRRVTAVRTADGERIPADAVVLTPETAAVWTDLLGRPLPRRAGRGPRFSPSCVLLHLGSARGYADAAHHTILFGAAWRSTFDELIDRGRLMFDPSLLVTTATRTDPSLAPPGRHTYYVLAPAPHTGWPLDWAAIGPRYRDELLGVLDRRGYPGLGSDPEVQRLTTPADWAAQGLPAGAPFSLAHTMAQTGPFRPANFPPEFDNVVLAGSGTHPGVGVPMVLISGRLAAERITGPDPAYRSRAWP